MGGIIGDGGYTCWLFRYGFLGPASSKRKKKIYMNASSRQFGGLDCSVADVIVVGQ